jgi:hypothetical protein
VAIVPGPAMPISIGQAIPRAQRPDAGRILLFRSSRGLDLDREGDDAASRFDPSHELRLVHQAVRPHQLADVHHGARAR